MCLTTNVYAPQTSCAWMVSEGCVDSVTLLMKCNLFTSTSCVRFMNGGIVCYREFRKQIKVTEQRSAARRPQKRILPMKVSQDRTALITPGAPTKSLSPTVVDGHEKGPVEPIVIDD